MADMSNGSKTIRIGGWVSAFSLLVAIGMLFLPLVYVETAAGERVYFYGATLLFGGTVDAVLPSGVYSFAFGVNLYLLIATQVFLLSAVSAFLAKQSHFNRIFSLVLGTAGIVLISLTPLWLSMTSSLTQNGTHLTYGYILSCVFASASMGIEIVLLFMSLGKSKKPRESEKPE